VPTKEALEKTKVIRQWKQQSFEIFDYMHSERYSIIAPLEKKSFLFIERASNDARNLVAYGRKLIFQVSNWPH
jgi:hypothetical protein